MRILFLHLSDAHIKSKVDVKIRRIKKVVDSLNMFNFDECILIFSGDLAYKGIENEYKHVEHLFGHIISLIKRKHKNINNVHVLIVPGNHDIDHTANERSRQDIVDLKYNNKLDNELEKELDKLTSFFKFAERNKCFINDKVIDKRILCFNEYKIGINLVNTAIFSVKEDERGAHYIPQNYIDDLFVEDNSDVKISIMHHGPDWFMVGNKNRLERALYKNSSIVFIGHEHDNNEKSMKINNEYKVDVIHGGTFNDSNNPHKSEYYVLELDTISGKYKTCFFTWDKDSECYISEIKSKNKKIIKVGLHPKESFIDKILSDEKQNISDEFTDYFVFPRIEKESDKKMYSIDYEFNEYKNFLNEIFKKKKVIIFGEDNSGKTTLLKRVYLSMCKSKVPLFFDINDIKNKSVDKMIEMSFEEQYSKKAAEFSKYQQMDRENKVAIVDDVNFINKRYLKSFIVRLSEIFDYIILGSKKGWNFDIRSEAEEELEIFSSFKKYNILEFFSDKRKELIEKVCFIKEPENIDNIKVFVRRIDSFIHSQIKLFDLNPDFIIQYINYFINNGYSYSGDTKSFSKVFEANITRSLEKFSDEISVDKMFTLLSKIAHYIHFNKRYPLSITEYSNIIEEYNKDYGQEVKPKPLLDNLFKAKIMKYVGDTFNIKFTNNSYLSYFVASELLMKYNNEGNSTEFESILKNICFGINSDIILFVSYLTNNINILKYFYSRAKEYIKDWYELSFDDKNINFLNQMHSELEVSLPEKCDYEEFNKITIKNERELRKQERIETVDIYNYDEQDVNLLVNKLTKSLKYTQVIAKILPSFEHVLKINDRNEFVKAIYSFPNRILYFWLKNIDDNIEDIIEELCVMMYKNSSSDDNDNIKEDVIAFLEDIITAMILSLYDSISAISTNEVTIKYLEEFSYQVNTNYEIQNIMMHETLDNIKQISKKVHGLYNKTNIYIVKLMLKKIVRKYFLIHINDYSYSEMQKLFGNCFTDEEKKQYLREQLSKGT